MFNNLTNAEHARLATGRGYAVEIILAIVLVLMAI